jgi:amino acid adenylation domain-containing protein/non-ribosomal peptide synthase protein (TIGR01720 family)
VRGIFGVEIGVSSIFEEATVEGLARTIERAMRAGEKTEAPPLIKMSRERQIGSFHSRLPLSFAQQRLWFIDQLEPGNAAYNIPGAVRLEGRLDLDAIERAINEIVRRHEVLRTRFETEDGEPAQVIDAWTPRRLEVIDLTGLARAERTAEVSRRAKEEAVTGFALSQGPLLRVKVLKLDEEEHVLLFTMHHIVSDGWSMGIMIEEIGALYRAYCVGEPSPLAELPIQYADFAVWQREYLVGEVMEREIEYWKKQLTDVAIVELPTDHPRLAEPSYRGGEVEVRIDRELSEGLRRLSQREGATLFMVLMAAFKALLMRYSGAEDVSVGTVIANRTRKEVEGLIGFFVNTLVMRTDLSGNPSFRELIKREREVSLGAYGRQEVPFERLVEEINPKRDLSRSPLFQVMMAFQNMTRDALEIKGLKVKEAGEETRMAKFDLTLLLAEDGECIAGGLGYSLDLYEGETIRRMARHYEQLVGEVVRDAEQKLSAIRLLSEAEREQILVTWNETAAEYPRERLIQELFEEQAEQTPEACAVAYGDQRLSYRDLNTKAGRLARYLAEAGVAVESRVGVYLRRSPEMMIGALGVMKAGGTYVPLEPGLPMQRLEHMLRDAGIEWVLMNSDSVEGLPLEGLDLVMMDGAASDPDWLEGMAEGAPGEAVARPTPENLAYILYTSGSTGKPKGVMATHRGLSNYLAYAAASYLGPEIGGSVVSSPLCFDATLTTLMAPLLVGKGVELLPEDETTVSRLAERMFGAEEGLLFKITPSHLEALEYVERTRASCLAPHVVVVGGEQLGAQRLRRWKVELLPEATFVNEYGPTETVVGCSVWKLSEAKGLEELEGLAAAPIGRPIANTRLYVLSDGGQLQPRNSVGELYIGGEGLARGYLKLPGLTAERFIPDPHGEPGSRMYRTGDLAKWRADGSLEFLGRSDHQVKIRGYRIELGEIEAVLNEHRSVKQSVVVAIEDERGDRRLVGYVVPQREISEGAKELRKYLEEKLPGYMSPSAIVVLEKMPLTPNGKLDRQALPRPEAGRREDDGVYGAPRTWVEELLVEIFQQALKRDRVGVHDNFFELGGDSILSIQIVSRANEAGLGLKPKQIFQHQSIAELAAAADQGGMAELEEWNPGGDIPLTPIQQWFFERNDEEPERYNQAVMLEAKEYLEVALLRKVVEQLVKQHDVLKHRFLKTENGWKQVREEVDGGLLMEEIDLSGVDENLEGEAIEEAAEGYQKRMDLEKGPLMRVVVFGGGAGGRQRVLIVAHHLVTDGVSWRILLGDIERGYKQAKRGEEIKLGMKTTSYRQWAERLKEEAQSKRSREEASYWLIDDGKQVRGLPTDSDGINTMASSGDVVTSLNEEETGELMEKASRTYQARVNEVLLSAVARAISEWSGEQIVAVEIEGHGREEIAEGLNLTRTVGWFTSAYPVKVEVRSESNVTLLQSVKELVRRVSRRGIYYGMLKYLSREPDIRQRLQVFPQAEIGFNYLGRLDLVLGEGSLFQVAKESAGKTRSSKERRRHLIEINGSVSGGRLHLTWTYSENLHRRETIAALAERTIEVLKEVGCDMR